MATVYGVVLASGFSSRFGERDKLLADLGGSTVIARTVRAYCSATERTLAVLPPDTPERVEAIRELDIDIVFNPDYRDGMSTSLRVGVAALPDDAEAAVIGVADQPLLSGQVIEKLAAAPADGSVIVPYYGGNPGNPSLYPRSLFGELLEVTGDVGGRPVRDRHRVHRVDIEPWWVGIDVDTQADLELVRSLAR